MTSAHYMLGPWKQDKDFVSSAYASKLDNTYGRLWVNLRRTQFEQLSSGLPLKADIARYGRHVSNVPDSEVAGRNNLVHFFSLGQCKLSVFIR